MAPISIQELHQFHRIDREVFTCLVMKLGRDPAQSLLVMALWLWLEHNGYPNIISKLVDIPDTAMINAIATEAVSCLQCLEFENFHIPHGSGLPLTTHLVQRDISLQLFRHKRFTAVAGIKSVLNNICARIFTDILYHLLGGTSTSTSTSTSTPWPSPYRPLIVPGFPHPLFGTFIVPPINFEEMDLGDPRIWDDKLPCGDVRDDDKTMFLTFSRGFPVTEEEVRHHFTSNYGDCIKILNMGNGDTSEQILYATMILNNVETVDQILDGKHIAKFRVNGKHVWARKYERRD